LQGRPSEIAPHLSKQVLPDDAKNFSRRVVFFDNLRSSVFRVFADLFLPFLPELNNEISFGLIQSFFA